MISGRAQSIAGGIALARAVVDSGKALAWLQRLRAFALHSRSRPSDMSGFLDDMARSSAPRVRRRWRRSPSPRSSSAHGPRRPAPRCGCRLPDSMSSRNSNCARRPQAQLGSQRDDWLKRVAGVCAGRRRGRIGVDGAVAFRRIARAPAAGVRRACAVRSARHAQGFLGGSVPGAGGARGGRRRRAGDRQNAVASANAGAARCGCRTRPVRAARGVRRRRSGRGARVAGRAQRAPCTRRQDSGRHQQPRFADPRSGAGTIRDPGAAAAARPARGGRERRGQRRGCPAHDAIRFQAGADRHRAHEPR